jgi:hypothetical protein
MELEGIPILADTNGYLQAIESDERVEIAREQKLVFLLHYRPGHFLIKGRPLGKIVVEGPMNESMAQCLSTSGRICMFFPIKNFIPTVFFSITQSIQELYFWLKESSVLSIAVRAFASSKCI